MIVLVCVLAVGSIASVQGQAPTPNPWAQVTRVTVNPGGVVEFEDYVKKIQAGRAKLGLPNAIIAYQVALGGNPYIYDFIMPFTRWEEVDANPSIPATLMKAYGEAEGAKILKSGRSAIQEVAVEVYRVRLDLSTNVKAGAPLASPFVTLTVTEHHTETVGSYMRLLAKVKKAEEQNTSAPTVIRYVLNTGEGAVTVAARPSNTLAERSAAPGQGDVLQKFYGAADAADMNELINKSIVKRSSVVLAHRPDLSSPGK
jgi:hypothetical protein